MENDLDGTKRKPSSDERSKSVNDKTISLNMTKNELIDKLLKAGFCDKYGDGEFWFTRASDKKDFVASFNSKDQMVLSSREPFLGCRTKSKRTTDYLSPNIFGPVKMVVTKTVGIATSKNDPWYGVYDTDFDTVMKIVFS